MITRRSSRLVFNFEQWMLMNKLIKIYDDNIPSAQIKQFWLEQMNLPLKMRYRAIAVNQLMQSWAKMPSALFQTSPDFLSFSKYDQSLIFDRSITCVQNMVNSLIFRSMKFYDDPICFATGKSMFGTVTTVSKQIFDSDANFMKISLSIMMFSTIDYTNHRDSSMKTMENPDRLWATQEKYIEVAWRYLLYRYNDQYAVKSFLNLVRYSLVAIRTQ